jgi:hypothetical protein
MLRISDAEKFGSSTYGRDARLDSVSLAFHYLFPLVLVQPFPSTCDFTQPVHFHDGLSSAGTIIMASFTKKRHTTSRF